MKVVGLTGSIATGKSFVARCFAKLGAAVFDADKAVHEILSSNNSAFEKIKSAFPDAIVEEEIDRKLLGNIVFADDNKRADLEDIIHPLVAEKRKEFIEKMREERAKIVVLEIPLLFEVGAEKECDFVIVTTVDSNLQEQRALQRSGMTREKFRAVNKLQLDSDIKVKKADFVIDTAFSEFSVFREVKNIMSKILKA